MLFRSLTQVRSDGSARDVIHLSPGRDVQVGRERGAWMFPYDPSMSAEHVLIRSEDADFVVVARTEAFIAGRGLTTALVRANAYADAGADAILVHSKKSTPVDIVAFMRAWDRRLPVLAVPTTYCHTPTAVFRDLGLSALIWANHLLRASIVAMQAAAAQVFAEQSVSAIDSAVAPVAEIFRLQRVDELEAAEERYLGPGVPLAAAATR